MLLSFKYRIEPNRTQAAALGEMLADFCQLYNAGLQQRIEAYRRRGKSLYYTIKPNELRAVRCRCSRAGSLVVLGRAASPSSLR